MRLENVHTLKDLQEHYPEITTFENYLKELSKQDKEDYPGLEVYRYPFPRELHNYFPDCEKGRLFNVDIYSKPPIKFDLYKNRPGIFQIIGNFIKGLFL